MITHLLSTMLVTLTLSALVPSCGKTKADYRIEVDKSAVTLSEEAPTAEIKIKASHEWLLTGIGLDYPSGSTSATVEGWLRIDSLSGKAGHHSAVLTLLPTEGKYPQRERSYNLHANNHGVIKTITIKFTPKK